MANIIIKTVNTKTSGGFDAQIISINPTTSDCLEGTVQSPGMGVKTVHWDLGGRCRDHHDSLNLDMRNDEMRDVRETAIRLGAST